MAPENRTDHPAKVESPHGDQGFKSPRLRSAMFQDIVNGWTPGFGGPAVFSLVVLGRVECEVRDEFAGVLTTTTAPDVSAARRSHIGVIGM